MSARVKSEPVVDDEPVVTTTQPPTVVASSNDDVDMMMDMQEEDDDEEEEEDEIVREMDVFLSPELSNQLYLVQFPLQKPRQHSSPPDVARLRPHHSMMELEYRTPVDIENFGQYHLPTRTYTSHTIPVLTHMALAKVLPNTTNGNDELHLIPLSRITQMRPSFAHVDEATTVHTSTDEEDALQKQQQSDAQKMERKPLGFQKKESERQALARKSSYGYKKISEESELWVSLEVHDIGSPDADEALQRVGLPDPQKDNLLVADGKTNNNDDQPLVLKNTTYVQTLNYLPPAAKAAPQEAQQLPEDGTANDAVVTNACTKLVQLMYLGWPIPFSILRARFPKSTTDQTLFMALGSCAVLVRGNFILQSRLLPMPPAVAQARTFVLFLLQTMEVVYRSRLEHVFEGDDDVNSEALLMLLQQVGTRTQDGWRLKVADDVNLAEQYPTIVLTHLQFWGNQVRRFGPLLERYRQSSA
jgi:DNA-directed RNA polymerase-3 subunit RPC5